jgi:uncharacterized protein RhaS with RHS repeats
MLYTVIRHDLCKSLGLNLLEYVILDIVSQQCRNISMNGWAVIDKKGIAEIVGVGEAKVWNVICKLADFGFIEINDLAKQMRATDKYLGVVNSVQSAECRVQSGENDKQDLTPKQVSDNDKTEYTEEQKKQYANFNKWILSNAPQVAKMKEQMTIGEFFKVRSQMSSEQLKDLLRTMHNWEPLLKKNRNVFLTICNWNNRDR